MALGQAIKEGLSTSIKNKKEDVTKSFKKAMFNIPVVGRIAELANKKQEPKKEKDITFEFEQSNVEILKKSNILLTQIADNVYNIAAQLGAQVTSLRETEKILKEQEKNEFFVRQQELAKSEETSLEARQAIPVSTEKVDTSKQEKKEGLLDFIKKGFKLPLKDIVKNVMKGGLSFLKSAGGFLMRGLMLFTNPIGIAAAILGTIGFGVYKYFTDKEFASTVDNLFLKARDFIAEKFGQAKDLFSQYIIDPVIGFLTSVKDKVLDWMIGLLKKFEDVPVVGKIVKPAVESLQKLKSEPKAQPSAAPAASSSPSVTATGTVSVDQGKQATPAEIPKAGDKQPAAQPISKEQNEALNADIKKYIQLKDSNIDLDGLDPAIKKRLAAVGYEYFNATGKKIQINSAFRDPKEQAELFAKYGSPRAARPGKSKHEVGLAFDMNSSDANKAVSMGLFQKYGFHRPIMPSEPWHVEAVEARGGAPDNPAAPGQAVLVSNKGEATIPSSGVAVNENQLQPQAEKVASLEGGPAVEQNAADVASTSEPSATPVEKEAATPSMASSPSPSSESQGGDQVAMAPSSGQSFQSGGGGGSSGGGGGTAAEPISMEPSTGMSINQASMDVEGGYTQQASISNVDNSSSTISSTETGSRSLIPSPVADRGSLDSMAYI